MIQKDISVEKNSTEKKNNVNNSFCLGSHHEKLLQLPEMNINANK
jgi:hypothetical protein